MKREDILKVLTGAAIAALGAVLTYVTTWISGADFGPWTPTIVAVWSIVVNAVRKWISPTPVKVLFALATVLALSGGAFAADPPKPIAKCDKCGDSCACPAGFCPKQCTVSYATAYARVAKGESVVLCVGVDALPGACAVASLKGVAPGVYDCSLAGGVHVMKLRAVTYRVGNPFATPCSGGSCPAPSSRRR